MKVFPEIPKPKDTLYALLAGVAFLGLASCVQIASYYQAQTNPEMKGHNFIPYGLLWGFAVFCAHPAILGGLIKYLLISPAERIEYPRLNVINKALLWICGLSLLLEDIHFALLLSRLTGH